MALVPCKCGCGQKIESAFSYAVPFNGVKFKFLNESHYLRWRDRSAKKNGVEYSEEVEKIYDVFVKICGRAVDAKTIINKEIESWKAVTSFNNIYGYLSENVDYISDLIGRKEIESVFSIVRYVGAIIMSNAPKYKAEQINEAGRNEQISKEANYSGVKKKKKSLSELENEV